MASSVVPKIWLQGPELKGVGTAKVLNKARGCLSKLGSPFGSKYLVPYKRTHKGTIILTTTHVHFIVPGKIVAYNLGLLCPNDGLLWSTMSCCFGLLGFPGNIKHCNDNDKNNSNINEKKKKQKTQEEKRRRQIMNKTRRTNENASNNSNNKNQTLNAKRHHRCP